MFDLSRIKCYNTYFLTQYVLSSMTEQINFCMQVCLIPAKRSCTYCKHELRLVAENRQDHKTPVVYRCYNSRCKKYSKYRSIRDRSVFEGSHLSIDTVLHIIVLYTDNMTAYEQVIKQCVDE